jgi:hypothetical protein
MTINQKWNAFTHWGPLRSKAPFHLELLRRRLLGVTIRFIAISSHLDENRASNNESGDQYDEEDAPESALVIPMPQEAIVNIALLSELSSTSICKCGEEVNPLIIHQKSYNFRY